MCAYKRISPQPIVEGGTGTQTFTSFGVVCGGTTGTSPLQSIGVGTANHVLASQGGGVLPSFVDLATLINLGTGSGFVGTLQPLHGGTGIASITIHHLMVGDNTNPVHLLAPHATPGVPVISQGIAADPIYGVVVVAGGGTGLNTITDHSVMIGSGTAAVTPITVGTDGQVLIGATAADPAFATLTSTGGTVTFSVGANTLNLEVAGGGFSWSREAGNAVPLVNNHGYINTNVGLTTLTLPASAVIGATIIIVGESAALWTIAQNAGQNIQYGNVSTTPGVGGSLSASNRYDTVTLVCRVANTTWSVISAVGMLSVV
jgi:hypothetical protein